MKKAVVLFSVLFLASGFLFALTLSNSTFSAGTGYDIFSGKGTTIDGSSEFQSDVRALSLYGCYDVKIGKKMYSRVEYCLYVHTHSFNYGARTNTDAVNPMMKEGKSNKRVGGFFVIDLGKRGHVNIGGAISDLSLKLTDSSTNEVHNRRFVGVGLILEGQFDFNEHFSLRLGVSPDFIFFTMDSYDRTEEGGYEIIERRGSFSLGYATGARLGMAYKF